MSAYARFWGVRGSIPTPAPVGTTEVAVGGNTSCIEIHVSDETIFVLDAGTGIRLLGLDILGRNPKPKNIHLFITHTHWDHIQGFPFFVPAYIPGTKITVYGTEFVGHNLEAVLEGQQNYEFFPVAMKQMAGNISFNPISTNDDFLVDGIRVQTAKMHHPHPATVGYRFSGPDWTFVLSTDTEHIHGKTDEEVLRLARNADILVYDSQYTVDEFPSKLNWGHSTWEEGTRIASLANVKKLILFHHEPTRPDEEILEIANQASRIFPNSLNAIEGLKLTLSTRHAPPCQEAGESPPSNAR